MSFRIQEFCKEEQVDSMELESLMEALNDKKERLFRLDEQQYNALEADLEDAEASLRAKTLQAEFEKSEEYREAISSALAVGRSIKEKQKRSESRDSTPVRRNEDGASIASNGSGVSSSFASGLRMPEFRLDQFDGTDYLKFPSFIDKFESLVDSNPGLSPVEKFAILKGSLSGHASQLISSMLTTKENYAAALKIIKENFGDANLLLGLFVSKLHGLPIVRDAKSEVFQSVVFRFEQCFNEIKNLILRITNPQPGGSMDQGGLGQMDIVSYFLAPLLLSKVPETIQLSWMKVADNGIGKYDFPRLLDFLKQEIKSRQTCMLLSGDKKPPFATRSHTPPRRDYPATTALFVLGARNSGYCDQQDHIIIRCPRFRQLSIKEKRRFAQERNLCFRCLRSTHRRSQCRSQYRCTKCRGPHSAFLCESKDDKGKSPPGRNANSSPRKGDGDQPSTFLSSVEKVPSRSLLQIVELDIKNAHTDQTMTTYALMDCGATQSWIKEDVARKLGMKPINEAEFEVNIFHCEKGPASNRSKWSASWPRKEEWNVTHSSHGRRKN